MNEEKAYLVLEDGTWFEGYSFGAKKSKLGEIVFNTGMTGYQEILSDPSYCEQIITMTYPLIGNYGINLDDFEALEPHIAGMVVREISPLASNWRQTTTLHELLEEKGIPGIYGIDTRKLTRIIRSSGTMRARIIAGVTELDRTTEFDLLQSTPLSTNQVSKVSTKTAYHCPGVNKRVVLMDFGTKTNIVRELTQRHCDVRVVPHDTTAQEILALQPDGVLLSNGPGDPKDVQTAIDAVRELLGKVPLFGICLGHQLFALACGADTEKMKFGHRGSNHPVKELETGKVMITSQNHGYAVKPESLSATRLQITHVAVNDQTVEGLKHLDYPAFSVQYHPEAAPGPQDNAYLFERFMEMMEQKKQSKAVSSN